MDCRLDRITVHYEAFGDGRPFVVLPGWPDDWTIPADYLEPVLAGRPGWRRIYLDLPGRGRTPGEPWITSNAEVLEIVLAVLDRLIPGQHFVLAGHSAGAYLARAIVHRRAALIDGVLQVVPASDPTDDDTPVPDPVTLVADPELVQQMRGELGPEAADRFAGAMVVQTPRLYERYRRLLPGMTSGDAPFLRRLDQSVGFDVDPLPAPFPRPALFVLGRQDAAVGYRAALSIMEQYPRATVAVLDRAGHALPWEQETLFRALVGEWLTRIKAETAPRPLPS